MNPQVCIPHSIHYALSREKIRQRATAQTDCKRFVVIVPDVAVVEPATKCGISAVSLSSSVHDTSRSEKEGVMRALSRQQN
jgi:hypothetical protein